ncbi:hypothetical protein H257_10439 [Aphanomyces astaci]|uniref:EGF-like domain-containing protein n=2 Tax=Aphanomyces astaci TaxID=112090 RepID=W4G698_APHAT|nr:hypothetical protein H257_10439 [Aphanomyces astaci]ETV75247.1 hypothetical protein H257_10439 [Aphanomyces astaci]|eukprot:XP_009835295.1 hypothetical protein H257_10439 [Aphanomyces astaci]
MVLHDVLVLMALLLLHVHALDYDFEGYPTRSGIGAWVDADTPLDARSKQSSRGESWDLVMSDEFEEEGRTFEAGKDHIWTALDIPDGVNAAIGLYSPANVYTKNGKLINRVEEVHTNVTYFNQWLEVPAIETNTLYYAAGMMQSWNKFCMQGGLIEVAAKLPGAINILPDDVHKSTTMNPNALGELWKDGVKTKLTPRDRVKDGAYYPTWPGIWLLGNLGRALFSASTSRMWPWTYNECDADLSPHQAISACDPNPGYGLHPNQGRGAPEIDILEGGGAAISSSIQIAPGMPDNYRRMPIQKPDSKYCVYGKACDTPGANFPDVPTSAYAYRGHRNWYQGLKYAANNRCPTDPLEVQQYEPVKAVQMNPALLTTNVYNKMQVSAGRDASADLGLIDGKGPAHWGINYNGTCFPIANGYIGAFLCDPDSKNLKCEAPRREGVADTNQMHPFEYQMDAISANWDIGHDAYTEFYVYQIEWVLGESGYVRWMLEDAPLFEIPSVTLTKPPQAGPGEPRNPIKLPIEEPLYIIFNIAVARAWGATPPNADIGPCRGNASKPVPGTYEFNKTQNICDSFPMYMEIEYIRVYQEKSSMFLGCDPPTHPTKKWIDGHIQWFTDAKNPMIRVDGGATCNKGDDCQSMSSSMPSGRCVKRRCSCVTGYGGPRCTRFLGSKTINMTNGSYFGPPILYPIILTSVVAAAVVLTSVWRCRQRNFTTALALHTQIKDEGDDLACEAPRRYYAPANLPGDSKIASM